MYICKTEKTIAYAAITARLRDEFPELSGVEILRMTDAVMNDNMIDMESLDLEAMF